LLVSEYPHLYTDANGQATIDLADGTYYYRAAKGGYVIYEDDFEVDGVALQEDFTLVASTEFISEWRTTTADETITLPLDGADEDYDFTVDWGDGSAPQNITTASASHEYEDADDYTITITGEIKGFRFNNAGDKVKIK